MKEHGGPWVMCRSCYTKADFGDKFQIMLSPHYGGSNGEWREVDARNDVGIIKSLLILSFSFIIIIIIIIKIN